MLIVRSTTETDEASQAELATTQGVITKAAEVPPYHCRGF